MKPHFLGAHLMRGTQCAMCDLGLTAASWGGSCTQDKLTNFLRGCGYKKEDIAYVPISGLYGDNIKKSVDVEKLA